MLKSLIGPLALYFVGVVLVTSMLNMFAGADINVIGWATGSVIGYGIVQFWTMSHTP